MKKKKVQIHKNIVKLNTFFQKSLKAPIEPRIT